ncbi:MAG: SRPBCC domain-containing protein [Saprospiraceae bacterium]|jgi:hypothetical protein|nr:SRPBCC domain-containing protein [Saprospiraceae bacterium]MBK7797128.1 SRPBCC domain-containing protein [Saprospiraceae bacterium]
MQKRDFNISFLVNQSPENIFKAITNVRAWWSEDLKGNSELLNDEFIYQHGEFHYSKHKLIEVNQFTKIVWLTLDSKLTFVKKNDEWNESRLIFEITEVEDKTKLNITHVGLTPHLECYEACSKAWTHYLMNSLIPLIKTGKGQPDLKK